jgi:predicted enzyme related to lactoylglutathione lyase
MCRPPVPPFVFAHERHDPMTISIYATSVDAVDAAALATFWSEALGRDVSPAATTQSASLAAREGTGDRPILFHAVPEAKTVKNRVHLDLITDDFDAELARLRELGATELATFPTWTTLADPEGNEFDLIRG